MPSTIVPDALNIRATAIALLKPSRSAGQIRCKLPKHFPAAQTEALLFELLEFTKLVERQQVELDDLRQLQAAQDAAFIAVLEADWDEQEDGRQFLETCAAEHSFRDLLV